MKKIDRIISESINKVINENNFKNGLGKVWAAAHTAAKREGGKSGEERFNDWKAKQAAIADINKELRSKRSLPKKDSIPFAVTNSFNDEIPDIGVLSAERMKDSRDYFNSENEFNGAIDGNTFDNDWLIDRDIENDLY